ncbi:hypothetical protein [Frigidibacter sp. MR17.24]|uniref:hypothetical protein n=1 Tax=Frigidibacter sp. MR17.24 TaxID=3127345 RepID=UPI003012E0A1
MYDKTDPRAALAAAKPGDMLSRTGLVAEPQAAQFQGTAPQIVDDAGESWLHRGHNFLVAYSQAVPGGRFERIGQVDEYAVLLPEAGARITWEGTVAEVPGFSLAFVPPGDSSVEMPGGGTLVRIFSTRSADLAALCGNAGGYAVARDHIPPFAPWPDPPEGWKLRSYSLDVAPEPGRFGRIFRCTTLMINILDPFEGPRDPAKMSPHHHDDFEQGSLALSGDFTHYLRWSWTSDMSDWRPDAALEMPAPSMLVIPPPVIHTTRATGPGSNLLIDIFGPPREDFSAKAGWVLNAEDYPVPSPKG